MLCTKCNSTSVSSGTSVESILYKENELSIEMEFSMCGDCGREFITKQQIQANDKSIRDAKRGADGLLMAEEVSKIRDSLGLTQKQAAQVFGGGANAFSKYERSEVVQSASMDKLIRLAFSNARVFDELLEMAGLTHIAHNAIKMTSRPAKVLLFDRSAKYEDYCSNDKHYAVQSEISA